MNIILGILLGGLTGFILHKMFVMKDPNAINESKSESIFLDVFGRLVTIGGAILVAYLVIGS